MILLISIFLLLKNLLTFNYAKIRRFVFAETLILSFLFFSIKDPVIGMPIYIYFLLFSIFLSFNNIFNFKNTLLIFSSFMLIFVLIVQIINLRIGIFNPQSLILNKSTTDLVNIDSQLFTPEVDFTVIKHFVFFLLFIFFIFANLDLICNMSFAKNVYARIIKLIFVLFILIFFEFILGNFFNLHNLIIDFNNFLRLDSTSAKYTFGNFYVVQGWLQEPSNIVVTFPYFFYYISKKNISFKNTFYLIFGLLACLLSTSTAGLIMCLLCGFIYVINLIKTKKFLYLGVICFFGIVGVIVFWDLILSSMAKIGQFLNFNNNGLGSGFYRGTSLKLAMESFIQAPFFGVGIGTVYCHGMVFQVISNIGVFGVIFTFLIFYSIFKNRRFDLLKVVCLFILYMATELLQEFTSPYILIVLYSSLKAGELENKIKLPLALFPHSLATTI